MSIRQFTIFFASLCSPIKIKYWTIFKVLTFSASPASAQLEKPRNRFLYFFSSQVIIFSSFNIEFTLFVFLNQSFSLQESSRETKNYVHCKKFAKIWVNIESIQDQSNSGCCILWQIFVKWSRGMKREMKWLTMSLIILNVGQSMAYIWLVKFKEYTFTCHVQYCKWKKYNTSNTVLTTIHLILVVSIL